MSSGHSFTEGMEYKGEPSDFNYYPSDNNEEYIITVRGLEIFRLKYLDHVLLLRAFINELTSARDYFKDGVSKSISQLAEKEKDIGLMDIQINHLKTLLESCEKSLRERESEVAESRKAELDTKQLQKLCTDFFFYWYNTSGSNTYQGCEEWFKTDQAKAILSTLLVSGEIVPTENEWISCKEIFPKDGQKCLVNHNRHGVHILQFRIDEDDLSWDTEDGDDHACIIDEVSHWMPLPDTSKLK